MLRIWGRGRHVKKSKIFWGSPKACQKVQDLCPLYVWSAGTKKNCQNGATQPPEQNAHACAHIQAAKPQPQGRTPVPTRCLLALCGCGLQGTLCRPGTRGPGCAGDLTARTKQQWPVQKWPGRGLEKGQEKEPAVLLITSGCEKNGARRQDRAVPNSVARRFPRKGGHL